MSARGDFSEQQIAQAVAGLITIRLIFPVFRSSTHSDRKNVITWNMMYMMSMAGSMRSLPLAILGAAPRVSVFSSGHVGLADDVDRFLPVSTYR